MGRGRAKAKQTKVARRLKYTTTGTDLDRLRAELSSGSPVGHGDSADDELAGDESAVDEFEDDYEDPYADYVDDEDDDNGGAASAHGRRR